MGKNRELIKSFREILKLTGPINTKSSDRSMSQSVSIYFQYSSLPHVC